MSYSHLVPGIRNRVVEILKKFSSDPLVELNNNTHLKDDLGIDSVDYLDLMFYMEKEFLISLDGVDVRKIRTVGDLENAIIANIKIKQRR